MSSFAPSASMIGRDTDLARLNALFQRASDGVPTAVLIEGEAGIGKSRMLREFTAGIANRADVHVGWCLDLGETRSPYGPLIGILRSLMRMLSDDELREAVGSGVGVLAMLLPEASAQVDRSNMSPELLHDAIAGLIERAAERAPQVIAIEDLHWADESTLAILSFLLRTLTRGRILLAFTCRSDDVRRGDVVSHFVGEATRARLLERARLDRLDVDAVRALVEQLTDDVLSVAALERVHERAEGVPFFVEEVACCASGAIPERLRDLLLARFDRLGDDARRLVRVASGAERPVEHPLLVQLADLDEGRFDGAAREATDSGILVVADDRYRFRHALLREAVHDDLLPGERSRLHRRYAEALEAQGADAVDPAALAHHWHLAQDDRKTLVSAAWAMRAAKARFAFASAARFGERVLELWGRVPDAADLAGIARLDLLLVLGSILRNAGDGERALAVVNLALDELDPASVDPRLHARLLWDKALYLVNVGRPGSIDLLHEALTVLDLIDDDRLRAKILNYLGSRYMIAGMLDRSLSLSFEAAEFAARAGSDDEVSIAMNVRAASLAHAGEVAEGVRAYDRAETLASRQVAKLRHRVNYSDMLTLLGRFRDAVAVAEDGLTLARRYGVERTTGSLMSHNLSVPLLELGEIERVESLLARELAQDTLRVFRLYIAMTRVRALAWRGRHEEAAELLRQNLPALREAGGFERQVWYDEIMMTVAVAESRGDAAGALDAIQRMLDDDGPRLLHESRLLLHSGWIIAQLRAGAVDVSAAVDAVRAAWVAQPAQLRGGAWESILFALFDPSVETLEAAIAVADGENVPVVFRAVTRLELARLRVRGGDRQSAAMLLAEATGVAETIGHAQLIRQVGEFAALVGVAPDASDASDILTARESQVLDLIARGLSNRQIGERLFISTKTVSVHVSAVLRKLGVSSRTEAAVAVQRPT